MKPIEINICMGTTCFVMGSGYLQNLADTLTKTYGEQVNVTCVRCLGICDKEDNFSKAPYVVIDNEVISEATAEKVLELIESKLKHA